MKHTTADGKVWTRDHPHEVISPHVMRFEVIRYWLKELSQNPEYGWHPGGRAGLERALGLPETGIQGKLLWQWIWPKEQVRLSARINDVLQGYIVPKRFGTRVDGVWTDPPQPPVVVSKAREIKFTVDNGRLSLLAQDVKPRMVIPSFSGAFKNVRYWDPTKRGPRKRGPRTMTK